MQKMNVRKSMMFVTILAIFVLLVAGCGGKKTSANSAQASEPTAAAASEVQGDATKGQQAFQSCVACHGPEAQGVQGLGKSLHSSESEFVRSQSDDELVQFIKTGRQPDDPANTTGVAMPPKGGNPAISDADLYNIVAWLRTLE
jgi:mono/diheme cytochrome c family protein